MEHQFTSNQTVWCNWHSPICVYFWLSKHKDSNYASKPKEIKEYDTIDYSTDDDSSFDELYADNDHAVIDGNTVRIVSNDHKSPAYIYDMQGRVIFAGTNREFTINRKGIFLLRFNNLSKKFIIR